MARIRTIKPEFFRSRSLARCSRDARLTFAGMWCDADPAGIGVAEPRILKGAIWPLDDDITPEIIAGHLVELSREHIDVYDIDGETYYSIRNWEKHQAASYRQGESKLPAPPPHADCTTSHADCTTSSAVVKGKGRERAAPDPPRPTPDPTSPGSDFDDFWSTYPLKRAKRAADKAWQRLKPPDRTAALGALPAHTAKWGRGDPKFIPHAATWLNGRRWEDDLKPPSSNGNGYFDPTTGATMSAEAMRRG